MKKFGKMAGKALIFCAVMMLLCSFAYPLALTGASQLAMKEKANGNLIDKEGNPTTDSKRSGGFCFGRTGIYRRLLFPGKTICSRIQ